MGYAAVLLEGAASMEWSICAHYRIIVPIAGNSESMGDE